MLREVPGKKVRNLRRALDADVILSKVANGGANNVSVIDTITNRVIATIPVGKSPHGIAVGERDGRLLVHVGNRGEKSLSIIDVKSNRVVESENLGVHPEHLTASPDRKHIYIGSPRPKIYLS